MLTQDLSIFETKSQLTRLGPNSDGGYVLPKKIFDLTPNLISIGVGFDLRFEIEFLDRTDGLVCLVDKNIDVSDFFSSNLRGPRTFLRAIKNYFKLSRSSIFIVNRKLISNENGDDSITFPKLLEKLDGFKNYLLKVDIERFEYELFSEENIILLDSTNCECLVVEFHGISEFSLQFIEIIRRLESCGYFIAHIHGNNYTPFIKEVGLYNCSEFTFVHERTNERGLEISKRLPINGVDYPSNPKADEISYKV